MVLVWLRLCISGEETVYNKSLCTQHQNGYNRCLHNNARQITGNTHCAKCGVEIVNARYQNGHGTGTKSGNGYNRSPYANLQYSSGFDITGCKKSGVTNSGCHHSQIVRYGCDSSDNCSCGIVCNGRNVQSPEDPTGHQSNLTDAQSKFLKKISCWWQL